MQRLTIRILNIFMVGAMLTLAACNTVEGFGEDIRGAGDAISSGANKTRETIRQR